MLTSQTVYLKPTGSETKILYSPAIEQIMFFARRFIQNVDWIMDLLSITDKLLRQNSEEMTRFERLIIQDYLNFRLLDSSQGMMLIDRAGNRLQTADLLNLRDQILFEVEKRALFLYYNPSRHSMPSAFKQVLAKIGDKELNDEEQAILREAFLNVHNGEVYTLRGKKLALHSRSQRWLWKLVS